MPLIRATTDPTARRLLAAIDDTTARRAAWCAVNPPLAELRDRVARAALRTDAIDVDTCVELADLAALDDDVATLTTLAADARDSVTRAAAVYGIAGPVRAGAPTVAARTAAICALSDAALCRRLARTEVRTLDPAVVGGRVRAIVDPALRDEASSVLWNRLAAARMLTHPAPAAAVLLSIDRVDGIAPSVPAVDLVTASTVARGVIAHLAARTTPLTLAELTELSRLHAVDVIVARTAPPDVVAAFTAAVAAAPADAHHVTLCALAVPSVAHAASLIAALGTSELTRLSHLVTAGPLVDIIADALLLRAAATGRSSVAPALLCSPDLSSALRVELCTVAGVATVVAAVRLARPGPAADALIDHLVADPHRADAAAALTASTPTATITALADRILDTVAGVTSAAFTATGTTPSIATRRLAERAAATVGTDAARWQLLFALGPSWHGTLDALLAAVDAVAA